MRFVLALSALAASLVGPASAQPLTPLQIADRLASSEPWPEAADYLDPELLASLTDSTGTFLPLGQRVADGTTITPRLLRHDSTEAAVALQLADVSGETETLTLFLRPSRANGPWRAREIVGFWLPGFIYTAVEIARVCQSWADGDATTADRLAEIERQIAGPDEELDGWTPDTVCADVNEEPDPNVRLITSTENEWRAFFREHRATLDRLLADDAPDAEAALADAGVHAIVRDEADPRRLAVQFGGMIDNTVGLLHVPSPDALPIVSLGGSQHRDPLVGFNDVIYLEELAPGWYLYWTT